VAVVPLNECKTVTGSLHLVASMMNTRSEGSVGIELLAGERPPRLVRTAANASVEMGGEAGHTRLADRPGFPGGVSWTFPTTGVTLDEGTGQPVGVLCPCPGRPSRRGRQDLTDPGGCAHPRNTATTLVTAFSLCGVQRVTRCSTFATTSRPASHLPRDDPVSTIDSADPVDGTRQQAAIRRASNRADRNMGVKWAPEGVDAAGTTDPTLKWNTKAVSASTGLIDCSGVLRCTGRVLTDAISS
jgi:hypothetical protein